MGASSTTELYNSSSSIIPVVRSGARWRGSPIYMTTLAGVRLTLLRTYMMDGMYVLGSRRPKYVQWVLKQARDARPHHMVRGINSSIISYDCRMYASRKYLVSERTVVQ